MAEVKGKAPPWQPMAGLLPFGPTTLVESSERFSIVSLLVATLGMKLPRVLRNKTWQVVVVKGKNKEFIGVVNAVWMTGVRHDWNEVIVVRYIERMFAHAVNNHVLAKSQTLQLG